MCSKRKRGEIKQQQHWHKPPGRSDRRRMRRQNEKRLEVAKGTAGVGSIALLATLATAHGKGFKFKLVQRRMKFSVNEFFLTCLLVR
jgi:hypothetical protein